MAPMDIKTAAKLQLTEAETVRLEEIRDAWKASTSRVTDLTEAARELTKEARRLDKTADGFLQEAEQERKRAKKHYNAMAWYTDHPVEASRAVWRVASDDKAKDSKQAS